MSNAESSQSTPADYLGTFSLRCNPFADSIDNRFFYAGTTLMQRLDLLTHLTQFGDSVVLVSGPPGSGKTTLLSRFIGQAKNQWRLCLIDAADDFSQFPARLADTLGSGSACGEEELLSQWADHSDNSQLLVIVIDNSELLDGSALDRLCALLGNASADRLRIILFGAPETQQRLKQAFARNARSCSTQRLEMPRLNEEETSSYLMYRLAVAGYSGESPFTATQVRAMCKAADGRPAGLNRLADQALLEHQARSNSKRLRPVIGKGNGNALAWGLASLGVLSVAAYMGWQRFDAPSSEDAVRPLSQQQRAEERPLALPEPTPLPTPVQRFRALQKPAQTRPPATETVAQPAGTDVSAESPPKLIAEMPPADATDPPVSATSDDTIVAVIAQPSAAATHDNHAEEKTAPPVAPSRQAQPADRATVKAEQPATAAETAPQAAPVEQKPAKQALPHRESWLLQQPEALFSLQLVGSRNEKSIADYIRRHKLDENQAAYYRGNHQGAAWYVLMYGLYPTREAALEGRDTLPARIRKAKPWPRSLKAVHASIRELQ